MPSFHRIAQSAGGNLSELTAGACCGGLLGDGLPAALRRAGPHIELVFGGGTEVRETPAGLGWGCNVDVV